MTFWRDKVVLVTGGSSGLGLSIAREFAKCEAIVCLLARDENRLQEAQQKLSQDNLSVQIYAGDVLKQEDVESTIQQVVADHGKLDVLVNNVGKSTRSLIAETTVEQFEELMELNFYSLVRCTKAVLPELIKTGGHVVNIGSLASKTAWPYMGSYAASKHAVAAYTSQLRIEGPEEVHFMLVCPGPIQREDSESRYDQQTENLPDAAKKPGAGAKLKRLCPDKLAQKIVVGCQRRQPELIMPGKARFLFVLAQISTRLGDWLIRKKSS